MSFAYYDYGATVHVEGRFTQNAKLADPATIKLSVKTPAGDVTTYTHGVGDTITKDATGCYSADVMASQVGRWFYRWWSATPGSSKERPFEIRRSEFT